MSCFTVDELMEKNRQLANENDGLRAELSDLEKKVKMLERTVEGQKNTIFDLRIRSRRGKELTVDEMLKELSKIGARSVMIGLN